jgi:hypothetical protein
MAREQCKSNEWVKKRPAEKNKKTKKKQKKKKLPMQ